MNLTKQTIKDIDVKDKTVLVRVDFNEPLTEDGEIADDYRIRAALPTIEYLMERNCKVVLISHLGRPDGSKDKSLSLALIAPILSELLGSTVTFVDNCIGRKVSKAVEAAEPGSVLLCENLRFYEGEEANDPDFAQQLAEGADVFVQDGFGVVHRSHASTAAITEYIPSVAGLLVEKEYNTITEAIENPTRPLVTIAGGAKVSDKIETLKSFIKQSDAVVIGGALANTFLVEKGINVGKSTYEAGLEDTIHDIYDLVEAAGHDRQEFIWLPETDVAVAQAINADQRRVEVATDDVGDDDYILDIGHKSTDEIVAKIQEAGTVIWNGPLGYTELPEFTRGSRLVAEAIADSQVTSVIGGGDTAAFIYNRGDQFADKFDHVSTGGGASLDLMGGKQLPGIEALQNR